MFGRKKGEEMKEFTFKLRLALNSECKEYRERLYDTEQDIYKLTSDNLDLNCIGSMTIRQVIEQYKKKNNEI